MVGVWRVVFFILIYCLFFLNLVVLWFLDKVFLELILINNLMFLFRFISDYKDFVCVRYGFLVILYILYV